MSPREVDLEEHRRMTMNFVMREKLGKLRTYHSYLPPGIRRIYLDLLNDIGIELGVVATPPATSGEPDGGTK